MIVNFELHKKRIENTLKAFRNPLPCKQTTINVQLNALKSITIDFPSEIA